jgi:hypothetical protein
MLLDLTKEVHHPLPSRLKSQKLMTAQISSQNSSGTSVTLCHLPFLYGRVTGIRTGEHEINLYKDLVSRLLTIFKIRTS